MTTDLTTRPLRSAIMTIALLAAAMLTFQLLVLRVAAVRLHFHFGTLLVANSLLGIGVAAAVLSMCERSWRLLPEVWSRRACLGFLVSLPCAWAWMLAAPVPGSLWFQGTGDWFEFFAFGAAGALPFVFSGAAMGLLLAANVRSVHAVQGSNLIGAGLACLAVPFLLWHVGAGGCFVATMVLAAAATAAAGPMEAGVRAAMMLLCAVAGFGMPRIDAMLPIDGPTEVEVGQAQSLAFAGRPLYSRWSADARIDLLPLADHQEVPAPSAESAPPPAPLRQWWLAADGDQGAVLSDFADNPTMLERLRHGVSSAALTLKGGKGAKVCILGLGGGTDAWAAKLSDASRIRVIEPHLGVLELHHTIARAWSGPLLEDARIDIACDDGRAALMRSDERFDVILTTDDETWSSLHSGAQALAPDYLYSVNAFQTMLDRLAEGGVLQVTRLAAGPETIRLLQNVYHALAEGERAAFAQAVAVLRPAGGNAITVLICKGGFPAAEATQLRQFAQAGGLEPIVLPDSDLREQVAKQATTVANIEAEVQRIDGEIGIRNEGVDDKELLRLRGERARATEPLPELRTRLQIAEFVLAADKREFMTGYPFDISPTTDDRPYFHDLDAGADPAAVAKAATLAGPDRSVRLLRWQTVLTLGLAVLALLLPLLFRGGSVGGSRRGALRFLLYFTTLAIGGVGMEVAIMQKFTLLLGQPQYSIAVTLASLCVFGGIGSIWSQGMLLWEPQRGRVVAVALFGAASLIALLGASIVDLCIGLSLAWRSIVVALLTAPIGLLLGLPLPHGVRVVERVNPSLVPWTLAVTAAGSALGALLSLDLSMAFGFGAGLFAAGMLFLVAFAAIDGLAREGQEPVDEAVAAVDEAVEQEVEASVG